MGEGVESGVARRRAAEARPGAGERESLLATKLRVPRTRPGLLARRRLVERLDEAANRELLLLSAPPGFGKSTLLADWARSARRRVAWISLDPDDNDPSRFWRYVVAALGQVHPGLDERVGPLLRAQNQPSPQAVVGPIVNDLAGHPEEAFALVLDDYHAIESPAIHEGLALLLERLPPGLLVVIAGRTDPPLPLALMRARGQLTELRAQDLRFTSEETAALLVDAWGLNLPEGGVSALAERTEGWATGLQLAALSVRGTSDPVRFIAGFTGSHRYVLDYLTEEVLERQPDPVRSFLLETSILERLSGPLCDAITGDSNGQQMLESVERANLFLIALDDERRWYRYHRLFADLLQVRLQERDGGRLPELYRRAAAWCDEHGLVDDAVRYALAGGDAPSAARIVERHVDEVLGRGEGSTLRRWLSTLPSEVVRSRPGLCLMQAITAFNAGHLGSAEAFLDDAERALRVSDRKSEPEPAFVMMPEGPLAMIPVTIASARASIATARGEPEQARALLQEVVTRLAESDRAPSLSVRWNLALVDWMEGRPADAERELAGIVAEGRASRMPHMMLSAGAILGRIQRAQGRLGAALRTYNEGLDLGSEAAGVAVPTTGEAHVGIAEVLYQRDQLDDALRHLAHGIDLCRQLTSTQALATGLSTLAWVRWATGDNSRAGEAMEEAYRVLPSLDVVSLSNPVPAERARLLLAQGKVLEAARWVEERRLGENDEPTYAREREYLVLARLLLARAAPDRALTLLGRLAAQAAAQGRVGSVIEVGALEALALSAIGDRTQGMRRLIEVLALGRREGYVRVFADQGRPMAALLGGLVTTGKRKGPRPAHEIPAEYLDRVLQAARRTGDHPPLAGTGANDGATGLVEALTVREVQVLEKLAAGKSNREIADEFVVTLDTVKKHVTHIFEKLGATNRTEAVAVARQLGLLN